jgi:hypothetical protein
MHTRPLGSEGHEVSELGLGCMGMSEFYGAADESESVTTIHRATASTSGELWPRPKEPDVCCGGVSPSAVPAEVERNGEDRISQEENHPAGAGGSPALRTSAGKAAATPMAIGSTGRTLRARGSKPQGAGSGLHRRDRRCLPAGPPRRAGANRVRCCRTRWMTEPDSDAACVCARASADEDDLRAPSLSGYER